MYKIYEKYKIYKMTKTTLKLGKNFSKKVAPLLFKKIRLSD